MANEITQLRRAEVQPAEAANVALPTVAEQMMVGLQQAIGKMGADDVAIEISNVKDGHRSSTRISLRAYKKGRRLIDDERDV
jgi:hypothetical protein